MRLLSLIVRIALFLLVLLFALANTHTVTLTLLPGVPGLAFDAPLVLWLVAVFALGVLVAVLFMLPTLVRKSRAAKSKTAHDDERTGWRQGADAGMR